MGPGATAFTLMPLVLTIWFDRARVKETYRAEDDAVHAVGRVSPAHRCIMHYKNNMALVQAGSTTFETML
jgi:hypothetical protein